MKSIPQADVILLKSTVQLATFNVTYQPSTLMFQDIKSSCVAAETIPGLQTHDWHRTSS